MSKLPWFPLPEHPAIRRVPDWGCHVLVMKWLPCHEPEFTFVGVIDPDGDPVMVVVHKVVATMRYNGKIYACLHYREPTKRERQTGRFQRVKVKSRKRLISGKM